MVSVRRDNQRVGRNRTGDVSRCELPWVENTTQLREWSKIVAAPNEFGENTSADEKKVTTTLPLYLVHVMCDRRENGRQSRLQGQSTIS